MKKDLLWEKYENAKIERSKAEVVQIKARRAADMAEMELSRAIDAEMKASEAWREALKAAREAEERA